MKGHAKRLAALESRLAPPPAPAYAVAKQMNETDDDAMARVRPGRPVFVVPALARSMQEWAEAAR